jgi:hypothetical protein
LSKDARKTFRQRISQAKSYEMLESALPGGGGLDGGEVIMREIQDIMKLRVSKAQASKSEAVNQSPKTSPE